MITILETLHKYVPTVEEEIEIRVDENTTIQEKQQMIHPIYLGGDQLTVARARAAKTARASEITPTQRLEGLVPTLEDWHTRLCLLTV